ncbi:MAG: cupredoxin family copper-binding protein [Acidobacteriaceae bacterium]
MNDPQNLNNKRPPVFLGVAIAVIVIVGLGIYYFASSNKGNNPSGNSAYSSSAGQTSDNSSSQAANPATPNLQASATPTSTPSQTAAKPQLSKSSKTAATGSSSQPMNMQTSPATSTSTTSSSATATATTASVVISNFSFSPAHLSVKKGTRVTWLNNDSAPHTVTGGNGGPSSPTLATGQSYSYTFNQAGTFDYYCSIHPYMTGSVTVTE